MGPPGLKLGADARQFAEQSTQSAFGEIELIRIYFFYPRAQGEQVLAEITRFARVTHNVLDGRIEQIALVGDLATNFLTEAFSLAGEVITRTDVSIADLLNPLQQPFGTLLNVIWDVVSNGAGGFRA